MWVIRLLVLSAVSPVQELSYFSSEALEEGSIISIPLQGKEGFGLVTRVTPLTEEKQDLKENTFTLRKLKKPEPKILFRRSFLRALFIAANENACTPGSLLSAFVPAAVLKKRQLLPQVPTEENETSLSYEPLVLTQNRRDRVAEYKRLSREALARGSSLIIICPTITEVLRIHEELSHGIEEYVEALHSELSEKRLLETWKRILEKKTPCIIVGTLFAVSVPRSDVRTIILERENSRTYNSSSRPFFLGATVVEEVARALGARFILAATMPSVSVMYRKLRGEIADYGISTIHLSGPTPSVVDLKALKFEKGKYNPLSPLAYEHIQKTRLEGKRVLVVAARRGLAPLTVCDDCGTTLTCAHCGAVLVLHRNGSPIYLCHQCGAEESSSVRCRKCTGWRLTTLGISVDRVADALLKQYPDETILTLSTDTGSRKEAEKVLAKWNGKGAGILVATERSIPFLPDFIPCVVVASVDTYLGIPEYSATADACTLLSELRTRCEGVFVLQSRNLEHRAVRTVIEGILSNFYKDELRDREKYGYPPFSTLIRFSFTGKVEATAAKVKEYLRALEHLSPLELIGQSPRKDMARIHILLRLPKGSWIDPKLLRFIRTLPPNIEVRVNPRNIHTG